jgi:hypothetical protein
MNPAASTPESSDLGTLIAAVIDAHSEYQSSLGSVDAGGRVAQATAKTALQARRTSISDLAQHPDVVAWAERLRSADGGIDRIINNTDIAIAPTLVAIALVADAIGGEAARQFCTQAVGSLADAVVSLDSPGPHSLDLHERTAERFQEILEDATSLIRDATHRNTAYDAPPIESPGIIA